MASADWEYRTLRIGVGNREPMASVVARVNRMLAPGWEVIEVSVHARVIVVLIRGPKPTRTCHPNERA